MQVADGVDAPLGYRVLRITCLPIRCGVRRLGAFTPVISSALCLFPHVSHLHCVRATACSVRQLRLSFLDVTNVLSNACQVDTCSRRGHACAVFAPQPHVRAHMQTPVLASLHSTSGDAGTFQTTAKASSLGLRSSDSTGVLLFHFPFVNKAKMSWVAEVTFLAAR